MGINWILAGVGLPPPVWGGVLVGGKAPSHRRLQAKDGEAAGTVGGVEDVGEVRLQWCGRERPPPNLCQKGEGGYYSGRKRPDSCKAAQCTFL